MTIQEYIKQKKDLYDALIEFLDSENDEDLNCNEVLIKNFAFLNEKKDQEEIESFLRLIVQIVHYHHKNAFFNNKIEQILYYFSCVMKEILPNSTIFNIFKSNRKFLLYLIRNQIIILDNIVLDFIINNTVYRHFFYPEIKSYLTKEEEQRINKKLISDDFENKREKGENDSYISELIRNDSIKEFITYISRNNISISATNIKPSFFELNSFLIDKELSLIEYAAFFGSIQIFQYLRLNGVVLTSFLWICVIHSNNAELIHILEENHITPPNNSYNECFFDSIKCHHNNIAHYIEENYLSSIKLTDEILDIVLRYYNYSFFPENVFQQNLFFYFCNYKYNKIVDFIIQMKKDEFEAKIIFIVINGIFIYLFHYKDIIKLKIFMKLIYFNLMKQPYIKQHKKINLILFIIFYLKKIKLTANYL